MGYAKGYGRRKLSWSREKWLHRPTQEVVDNSDPRVPPTVDQSKRQHSTWLLILSHATIEQGYYRREVDMSTGRAAEPTFTATWHPNNGPVVTLVRGSEGDAYWACVRHFQANVASEKNLEGHDAVVVEASPYEPGESLKPSSSDQPTSTDDALRFRSVSSFTDKLELLFDTAQTPDGGTYTSDDLTDALHEAGIPLAEKVVPLLRAGIGGPVSDAIVDAIARFFGVDPSYLTDDTFDIESMPDEVHVWTGDDSESSPLPSLPDSLPSIALSDLNAAGGSEDLVVSVQDLAQVLKGLSATAAICLDREPVDVATASRLTHLLAALGSRLASSLDNGVAIPRSLLEQVVLAWAVTGPSDTEWRSTYLWVAELLGRRHTR